MGSTPSLESTCSASVSSRTEWISDSIPGVANRADIERSGAPSPEDDWFASPADGRGESEVPEWEFSPPLPAEPEPPDLRRRQLLVLAAVVVAVILAGAAIVGVRAIGGSDDGTVTVPVTTGSEQPGLTSTTPTTPTTPTTTGPTTTPATTPTPPAASAVPTDVVLHPGDTGDGVKALQQALLTLGYAVGKVDGIYGAATQQAVTSFQQSSGLTEDGIAGAETIGAINTALTSSG